MTKNLSILGSTGSIGTQSLETARKCGYSVSALSAYSNVDLIEEQIREFKPKVAALVDENAAKELKNRVSDMGTKILSGIEGVCECACVDTADTVINSVVGMAGLVHAAHVGFRFGDAQTLVAVYQPFSNQVPGYLQAGPVVKFIRQFHCLSIFSKSFL